MYFENMTSDTEADITCAGMTEAVITSLVKLGKFNVIPRSSILPFKNQTFDLKKVKNRLGVDAVIQGSLQIVGNMIRVSAQLIDANKGNHIWADNIDSPKEDILTVQDQISHNVAGAMGIDLEKIQPDILAIQPTKNIKANEFASKGIYYFDREMYDLALAEFDSALAYDQDYSIAQYHKGQIHEKNKKYQLAIDSYNRALPKSEKFNRILWNWQAPSEERIEWIGPDAIHGIPNNRIIGFQEVHHENKTIIHMFDLRKKELLWSHDLPHLLNYPIFNTKILKKILEKSMIRTSRY